MNFLSSVLWLVALAAAVLAVVQLSRQSARLREELDELREAKAPEPAGAVKLRPEARPMFGELYETKPSPFEALAAWPGVPLACAAAGLFAIGLLTHRPEASAQGTADSTIARDIASARQQYDSLAKEVAQLHDSMVALRARPQAASASPARKAGSPAAPKQGTTLARRPATPESPSIAPLPSLPKVAP